MRSYGIPSKIITMVKALYDYFDCAVVDGQDTTEWFKIKTGVKQGCNMSGLLFLQVVDWVMRSALQEGNTGIRWKFTTKLEDLDFADDIFTPHPLVRSRAELSDSDKKKHDLVFIAAYFLRSG